MKTLSFRLDEFDRQRLEKIAVKRGKPATAIVRELVQRYVDSSENQQRKSA